MTESWSEDVIQGEAHVLAMLRVIAVTDPVDAEEMILERVRRAPADVAARILLVTTEILLDAGHLDVDDLLTEDGPA